MVKQSRPRSLIQTTNSVVRDVFIAAVAVVAALAPFLNKAFHIDDPLFLWIGQQIAHHPGDPYGFTANWGVTTQPMFSIMQNPPLNSYYIALVASFLGWSEPAMHVAFLVPAVAAVLGTFFLARRLSGAPLLAALLLLFMPVFLVSATSVMCDVWLLALWVWSVECWLRGIERESGWFLLLAAILAGSASLVKYFGISLVPLLVAYTLARERKLSPKLLYLAIPLAIISSYELITRAKYGQGLFSSAMLYSWKATAKPERHLLRQLFIGLSFTGGCLFAVLFYAPFIQFRHRPIAGKAGAVHRTARGRLGSITPTLAILIIGIVVFAVLVPLFHFNAATTTLFWGIAIEGALFVTVGLGILALAVTDLLQRKTADSVLLGLWVLGTFFFAAIMNWSITARTFLPMAPAVIILLIRRLKIPTASGRMIPYWPILPAALLSLLITIGDYKLAKTAHLASSSFQERCRVELGTIWFEGHWGFQYYMQQWNAKPLDKLQPTIASGDVLIVPINNSNIWSPTPELLMPSPAQVNFPQFPVTTMNWEIQAGFYASNWGPLPWVVARVPPEHYLIFRIK